MAPAPFIEDAAAVLADLKHIDFGLHISLNCEWEYPHWGPVAPLAQVPDLVDKEGNLLPTPKQLHEVGASRKQIMTEVRAQLQRLRTLGFTIAYMDEHMGVGWLPELAEELTELAAQEGLIFRPVLQNLPDPIKVEATFSRADWLAAVLPALRAGVYRLVGHPAYNDAEMQAYRRPGQARGEVAASRADQRTLFTDPGVLEAVERNSIPPVRYTDVFQPPA